MLKKVKYGKLVMASEQVISEAITRAVAEVTRITIQTMLEAWAERMHDISAPRIGVPTIKQPTFDWNAEDKYSELKTFRLEVNNVLSTYNTLETDKLAAVKNYLGRKGLQYLETLMTTEKETYNTLQKAYLKHYQISIYLNTIRQSSHYNSENYIDMMMKM